MTRRTTPVRLAHGGPYGIPPRGSTYLARHPWRSDRVAVHLAQRVVQQLEALAVGAAEVHRRAALLVGLDTGVAELLAQPLPLLGLDGDRQVVEPAEDLGVGAEVEPREVEVGEQVAVADVEEEVRRTLIVAVLEQLGQRELEQVLVEADRPFDVAGEQREVVHAPRRRRRPRVGRLQILRSQRSPFVGAVDVGSVARHAGERRTQPGRVRQDGAMASDGLMRAWRTHEYGRPSEVLHLDEVAIPEPEAGDARVRVQAIPFNLNDLERITGGNMMVRPDLPYSPGMEVMGVVDAVGPGAESWLGRRVVATTKMAHGGFAEY